ncbi:MAG: hypothetical protein WB524_07880 [Acidobacteriaceae bacterium]|jgi:tetratricopeptide (TPR) repeat protein
MKETLGQAIERVLEAEDWVGARKLIRAGLRSKPDDHWLLSRLALTFYEQGQYRRALDLDLKALQIAPYCPLAIWGYAGTLEMLGRTREARILFQWLVSWGEAKLAYGECGEGIRWARSLIADCYYRIGLIWEEKGQKKRALRSYAEHLACRERGARSIYPIREVKRRFNSLSGRCRTGFLAGHFSVPDDFDEMSANQISTMFHGVAPKGTKSAGNRAPRN